MSETIEPQAAEAPPNPAFPWRGFYGGKVIQISVTYDDMSATNIGTRNIEAIQTAHEALLDVVRDARAIIGGALAEDYPLWIERADAALANSPAPANAAQDQS